MKHLTWSLQIAAYRDGSWAVAVLRREFRLGVEINAELESLSRCTEQQLQWNIKVAGERMIALNRAHLEELSGRPDRPEEAAGPGRP